MQGELEVSIVWDHLSGLESLTAKAISVTFANQIGPFDILPKHANLISVIEREITFVIDEGISKTYSFRTGIVEVSDNQVKVFLESNVEDMKQAADPKSGPKF